MRKISDNTAPGFLKPDTGRVRKLSDNSNDRPRFDPKSGEVYKALSPSPPTSPKTGPKSRFFRKGFKKANFPVSSAAGSNPDVRYSDEYTVIHEHANRMSSNIFRNKDASNNSIDDTIKRMQNNFKI